MSNLLARGRLTLTGAALILVAGLIHLALAPDHFGESSSLGWLFLANFAGATVAAFGIYRGQKWGWALGALVALGAFVAYFAQGALGLRHDGHAGGLLEPLGVVTKALEVSFLVLCVLEFTKSFTGAGRWALVGGSAAVLVAPGLAMAVDLPGGAAPAWAESTCASSPSSGGKGMPGWPLRWKATSPSIQLGDRYSLVVTNNSEEDQSARIRTEIMDHGAHTNTNVIDEELELTPGEQCELTAVNDYGPANHFNTIIGSETQDLGLVVKVDDAGGTETARFSDRAFLMQEGKAKGKARDKAHDETKAHEH